MEKIIIFFISIFMINILKFNFNTEFSIIESSILSIFIFHTFISLKTKLKENKLPFNKINLIGSLFFSIFIEIGICLEKYHSIKYLFSLKPFFYGISTIIIFTNLFYIFFYYFNLFIDNYKRTKLDNSKLINRVIDFILNKHPFLSTFLLSLLTSSIYMIFYYPGSIAYDGLWQLNNYYGIWTFNNHHPALLTLLMGNILDLGTKLINNNFGIFLFLVLQILLNSITYSYVIKIMNKMKTPLFIRIISFLFYTCFPFLVINSITYIKDISHYLFFLLFYVYTYYHFKVDYKVSYKRKYYIIAILFLCMYLTRNNGYYINLISSISMILYYFKKDKIITNGFVALLIFTLILNFTYHNIFLVKMDIAEGSIR